MNDGYHAVGSALQAVLHRLNVATKDVVHARTPGYQKHLLTTQSFATQLDKELGRDASLVRSYDATVFEQGRIVPRNDPFAMALQGAGMFTVQTPNGIVYTRNGDFMVDADGGLRTHGGYAVLGVNGPIRIDPASTGAIVIDDKGAISQGEKQIGRLRLVEFEHRHELQRVSDTLFGDPEGAAKPEPAAETIVLSRHLEFPKGSTVSGMVAMIDAARSFEAAQRAARVMDDTFGRLTKQG